MESYLTVRSANKIYNPVKHGAKCKNIGNQNERIIILYLLIVLIRNGDYKLRDCNEKGIKYDVCKDETTA